MFGGFGVKPASQLNEFLEFDQYTFQWQKSNWSGDIPKQGLYGHTMQVYRNSFIIFGGAESQSNVTNQTLICNIPTKYVQQIRTIGDIPDPRKNHVAFTMGKSMLIHGGKNMRKQALNDLWNLDLSSQKWMKIQQDNQIHTEQIQNIYPLGVSYHRAVAVFHPERKNIGLFKGSERSYRNKNLIKKEGIYFYGGLDNEQNIIGDLLLLKLENNQHNIAQWEKIQTEGENPGNIYSHSMEFIQNQGLIIIYGGVKQISDSHQEMTDEIYILELSNLNWIKGVYKGGIQAGPRQSHLSFAIDNQMYIFGGINIQGFVSNDTFRLELNQGKVQQYLEQKEIQDELTNRQKEQKEKFELKQLQKSLKNMNEQDKNQLIIQQTIEQLIQKREDIIKQEQIKQQEMKKQEEQAKFDQNDILQKIQTSSKIKLNFKRFQSRYPTEEMEKNIIKVYNNKIQEQNIKQVNNLNFCKQSI